ncbi:hypothetical protein BJY04DRAFT_179098 [Aspergillus karnatakaensis]|uniref:uncharacterized protein n=1 Tax=Aspergillus karnatakaensis TaxID=1810916 RepID=UPI003CCCA303
MQNRLPTMSRHTLRSTFEKVKTDEEGEFVCQCGFRTKEYQVKKEKSPYYGLKFYACAKFIVDPSRCNTTIWSDEQERVRALIPPGMRSPRTPRKQVDIRIFGRYTPSTSSKRKAQTESFDSGVDDLGVNEPISPPPTRSVKRIRFDDEINPENDTAGRPFMPLPRRRLFAEDLAGPKPNPAAEVDPFAPRTLGRNNVASQPTTQPNIQRFRRSPPRTQEPMASKKLNRSALFAPETNNRHEIAKPVAAEPQILIQNRQKPEPCAGPNLYDSESDSYGWDDDLDQNIVQVADSIENPRLSPLPV